MALIYAGIDEAGYGPMFGPFVVARSVFVVDDAAGGAQPPSLWAKLKGGVCKKAGDKRRRIAVNDSKKLYTPAAGLGHLERSLLSFAHVLGHEIDTLDGWLQRVAVDDASRVPGLLWYYDAAGGPALPSCHTSGELSIARAMLARHVERAAVRPAELAADVVYEDRFNRIIEKTRSKASCAWSFVSRHIWHLWQTYGEHHPWVVVDRQGGRKVYHRLLQLVFEGAELRLLDESDDISRYTIRDGRRAITISFETKSDSVHLPVALASMTAKYTRELLMSRFNAFWREHKADIKPTAGYVQDGRRFLREIEPLLEPLGIDRRVLVRQA